MMIKKFTFLLAFLFLLLIKSQAQIITNAGFENWAVDSTGYLNPTDWLTSNGEETTTATVVQGPGSSGNFSAKLVSVDTGNGYAAGSVFFLYFGNIRPHVLSGFWKGTFSANEPIIASVTTVNSAFDVLCSGFVDNTISQPNWVAFSDTIDSVAPGTPIQTWVQVFLTATSINAVGYVDDLALTYTTDVGEIKTMNLMSSSLAHDSQSGNYFLKFDLNAPCPLEISVCGIDGKTIFSTQKHFANGHYDFPICLAELVSGVYFCRITGEGVNKVYKMVR